MKKTVKLLALLLTICLLVNLSAFGIQQTTTPIDAQNLSGVSTWSAIPFITAQSIADGYTSGEGCQHLTSLTRDTQDGELLFLGTDVGGLMRSTDGGDSWEPCIKGIHTRGVCRVAIDPTNKNHVIASAGCGAASKYNSLYYSYNMGESWTRSKYTMLGYRGGYYCYNTLQFDPSSYNETLGYCTDVYWSTPYERDGTNLLTAETAGLYRSTDGGAEFAKVESDMDLYDGILIIGNDGIIKLANQQGIFTQSEKHGAFTKVYDCVAQSFLLVGDVYYLMTDDGIYTSADLLTYEKINSTNFPVNREPRCLDISSLNPLHMAMSAKKSSIKYSERPFYSEDGGITWHQGDISDTSGLFYYYTYHVNAYTYSPTVAGEVIATQGGVVTKSTDWGKTWRCSNTGINNIMCGGKFNFNIYNNDLVYVGAQDFGGAISTDGGKTWKPLLLSKDGDGRNIYGGYAVDESTMFGVYTEQWGDSALRTKQRFVCFSHDGGKTVNITKTQLQADATQFESVRICEKIKGSWESSYQSPTDRNVLFCANFRSTDCGYTWTNMLNADSETKCLQVYTHSGSTLYGACDGAGYVVKSEDNGATWSKVNSTVLAGTDYHIADIAVDGTHGYIYAAYSSKLYRMDLNGENVVDLTTRMTKDNMGVRRIITVAVDPIRPEIVYCGGSGDYYQSTCGTRRSCDSGETWYTVTNSTASDCIVNEGLQFGYEPKCLRVNPQTGELWNGSSCLGFNKLSPPYNNCVNQPELHTAVTDAAVAATCTKTGLTEGSHCSVCGTVIAAQAVVEKAAHSTVIDAAVAATCTKTGLTEGSHCSVCGEVIVAQTVTDTVSHADNNGDGFCDSCGASLGQPKACSHMCHQSGFMGFMWKIVNMFNKLFSMNQYCTCGVAHW